MERLEYDLLFRWFVALGALDPVWDRSGVLMWNRSDLLAEARVNRADGHCPSASRPSP